MSQYYGNENTDPGTPYRFTRARYGRVLGGLCVSLARRMNVDVSLVRIITVVLSFATGGTAALVYLIAWLIVPEEGWDSPPPDGNDGTWRGPQPGAHQAPNSQQSGHHAQSDSQGQTYHHQSSTEPNSTGATQQGAANSAVPKRNNTIIFGGILILLGGYLLLNYLFGSIFRMRYFIPLLLMSLGIYIIYRAIDRKG